MVMVSTTLRLELLKRRARGERQYAIARAADVHPSVASALLNGIVPIRRGDPRVVRIGRVVGLSARECFEPAPMATAHEAQEESPPGLDDGEVDRCLQRADCARKERRV